jgi:P-type conjugative transfer protein TrbJ
MKTKLLAAKTALVVALSFGAVPPQPAHAGIPTIDIANLIQSILTVLESISQTAQQIQDYRNQLQQYENMIQNTVAPAAYIWDQAQQTMRDLRAATDSLAFYRNQLGSLDSYLGKFQDVAYYRNSPCFKTGGNCSPTELAALAENRRLASESQKKANDALFKGLDKQLDALEDDADTLERLQSNAQGAEGQMEAIQFANQLASQQANQLLQIRGLMMAQQNAYAAKLQADLDKEAQTVAASEQFRRGTFKPSTGQTW